MRNGVRAHLSEEHSARRGLGRLRQRSGSKGTEAFEKEEQTAHKGFDPIKKTNSQTHGGARALEKETRGLGKENLAWD